MKTILPVFACLYSLIPSSGALTVEQKTWLDKVHIGPDLIDMISQQKNLTTSLKQEIQVIKRIQKSNMLYTKLRDIGMHYINTRTPYQATISTQNPEMVNLITLKRDMYDAYDIQFSPKKKKFLVYGTCSVGIYDLVTTRLTTTFPCDTLSCHATQFSDDGSMIIITDGSTAKIRDLSKNRRRLQLIGHRDNLIDAFFLPGATKAITGSSDKTAKLWKIPEHGSATCIATLQKHKKSVRKIHVSPDGTKAITVSTPTKVWDTKKGVSLYSVKGHGYINIAKFSPDGTMILIISSGKAQLCNAHNGTPLRTWKKKGLFGPAAFSPDGTKFVAISHTIAYVWKLATGALLNTLKGHTQRINSVSFSSNSNMIATASFDQTTRIWDLRKEKGKACTNILKDYKKFVTSVKFLPDSDSVITISGGDTIKIWELYRPLAVTLKNKKKQKLMTMNPTVYKENKDAVFTQVQFQKLIQGNFELIDGFIKNGLRISEKFGDMQEIVCLSSQQRRIACQEMTKDPDQQQQMPLPSDVIDLIVLFSRPLPETLSISKF